MVCRLNINPTLLNPQNPTLKKEKKEKIKTTVSE